MSVTPLAAQVDEHRREVWIKTIGWLLAVVLASFPVLAAITKHSMNADGIAYLDIGDAYMRGDWQTAINPVWSPLYSWILGVVMWAVRPSMQWEFPLVHLVNFLVYLGTLVSFDFFWRRVIHYHQTTTATLSRGSSGAIVALPQWAWLALGYALFIWASLILIEVWAVTPDMLMAALVYLAAGLMLRIRAGLATWRTFVLLGLVLGLGYLAKSVMFPLALVFLAVSLLSAPQVRRAIPLSVAALVTFLLVSGPFIVIISMTKGRVTLGESGTLTYIRHVNGIPYPHWQGEASDTGAPVHPTRKILDVPPIFEFSTPIGGTYPVSHDPSYWYDGAVPRLNWKDQARAWLLSALFYFDLLFKQLGAWTAGFLILYLLSRWTRLYPIDLARRWGLACVAVAAFGLYALVYVEGRYVGVFVVLLWADLLANIRVPASETSRKLASVISATLIVATTMNIVTFNLKGLSTLAGGEQPTRSVSQSGRLPTWPGEVAEELHQLGVGPGDGVAVIGYAFDSFWARLARVRIVAELPGWQADPFWLGDSSRKAQVIQAFASTGAKAIVAERVPQYAALANWHRVKDTNFYIYILP